MIDGDTPSVNDSRGFSEGQSCPLGKTSHGLLNFCRLRMARISFKVDAALD